MGLNMKVGITRSLKLFGEPCSIVTDDDTLEFNGIFDQQNQLETVDGVSVILAGSSLTVEKSIGTKLTRGQVININDEVWYCREVLFVDDGNIAKVSIVNEESQC